MAMAPPFTLSFSLGMARSLVYFRTTAANASLSSNRSMSSTVSPAVASTLRVAGVGPVSMIVESAPLVAVATIRARGVNPCSEPTSTSASPSTIPEEFPGLCTWLIFSTQWYFCSATASKPPISPTASQDSGSLPSPSSVESGRMCSSRSSTVTPLRSVTGTTDLVKYPFVHDFAARSCEVSAYPLWDEVGLVVGLRVQRPGAAVGAHRHPGHRLDTTGDDQAVPPGPDLLRGHVDRLQPGRAEPVELHAADRVRQVGGQRRGLGDVHALVADRGHHAEHDVVDALGVQRRVALGQLVDEADHQRDRLGPVQGSLLAAAARGADRVVHERLGAHASTPTSLRLTDGPPRRALSSPDRARVPFRTRPPFRIQPLARISTSC